MGKDKLKRFRELGTLNRVFQPAFEEVYGKDYPLKGKWNEQVFKNGNPLVLELGCGGGEYTVGLASLYPGKNYMGLDIKGARIWKGARQSNDEGKSNVAFLRTRVDFISSFFAKNEVDEIWVTFPDPQIKKRRRKKRLTGARFLNMYRQMLKDKGLVHLKTDNHGLYIFTLELARYNNLVIERHTDNLDQSGWDDESVSIRTFYENIFRGEGKNIHFIQFRLPSGKEIKDLPYEFE